MTEVVLDPPDGPAGSHAAAGPRPTGAARAVVPAADRGLRVALLAYRGNPCSGGQGVYVRHLSRALTSLGHRVEVFSGPPYPVLDDGVRLTRVPSLDLYREGDPFRLPHPREFRGPVDVLEYLMMCTAAFPEPLTFSLRARRMLRARRGEFDVVHDNQGLGYGLLGMARAGLPVVATVHHPITVDRALELAAASGLRRRLTLRRWYAFTRMQARVARRLPHLLTVSEASREDIVRELGVDPGRVAVVPNGVDSTLFAPRAGTPPVAGRIVTTASADSPLKGLGVLVEALARLRPHRPDAHLVVVGRARPGGPVDAAVDRLGLRGSVRFSAGLDDDALAGLLRSAEVAVVPSLYEGFSLPAVEAMACGVPLVASRAGALPEVVGADGEAGVLVRPGDAAHLAAVLERVLSDEPWRRRLGEAGRRRVVERFDWRETARSTAARYREAMVRC